MTDTQEIPLKITYHEGQDKIFFSESVRKRIVAKGRRWGFTKGCAQFVIESMLDGVGPILWGDTIAANITSYVERYFLPVLNQLPKNIWHWKKQEKKLEIRGIVCDFRSSDQPENWEGFGYKIVILNEAGIILKNQYLWYNAVRPMLMDFPDSIAIIGGTPKGKNLFFELHQKGNGSDPNWKSFTFDSYSNPFLEESEIKEMEEELPSSISRQEIFAEFVGEGENVLIPYDLIVECMAREPIQATWGNEVWGVDVARHGDDFSVLAKRHYKQVYELKPYSFPDLMKLASAINTEYQLSQLKPKYIFIETTGIGWGVYDRCKELRLPVYPADVGSASVISGLANKRAEMYVRTHNAMKEGLSLINDKSLKRQLANVFITYNERGLMKLIPKEKIKEELGESPDHADAVALTYFEETPATEMYERETESQKAASDYDPLEVMK